jgi:hypothetical protein
VMMGISIASAVRKVLTDLVTATPAQVEEVQASLEQIAAQKKATEAEIASLTKTPIKSVAADEIALLEAKLKDKNIKLFDLRALAKEKEARAAELAKTQAALSARISERDRLKALLDQTPILKDPESKVVRIPNTRPIPEDAKSYTALAVHGRIHFIDPHTPLEMFKREFERRRGDWLIKRVNVKGKPDLFTYDGTKIIEHFKNFNWGNTRGQTIEIVAEPTAYFLWLVIRPNLTTGGTPMAELGQPGNEFAKAIPIIRQSFKSVLFYRVHPNSFETYLVARELTEKVNIPAGWEVSGSPEFRILIPGCTVKRLQEPPPKPPGQKPNPPGPKPKLD